MKKAIALLSAAAAILTLSSCSAAPKKINNDYLTYDVPENMIVMKPDDMGQCSELLSVTSMSEESAKQYLEDASIDVALFVRTEKEDGSAEYPYEFDIAIDHMDYSENIFNFAILENSELEKWQKSLIDYDALAKDNCTVESEEWKEINGAKYLIYTYNAKFEGNDGEQTIYGSRAFTIFNGNIYSLMAISQSGKTDEFVNRYDALIESFAFSQTLQPTQEYDPDYLTVPHTLARVWRDNWISIVVIAISLIALIVYLIVSSKKKKNDPKNQNRPGKTGGSGGAVRAQYLR